jgi:hypothetical protein
MTVTPASRNIIIGIHIIALINGFRTRSKNARLWAAHHCVKALTSSVAKKYLA